jgi:hypothetical protein
MAKRTGTKASSHTKLCFAELLSGDPELSALRADYAQKPATARRTAADWTCYESISNSLFGAAVARLHGGQMPVPDWPPGFAALAIDPEFAPALLTVGCYDLSANNLKRLRQLRKIAQRSGNCDGSK